MITGHPAFTLTSPLSAHAGGGLRVNPDTVRPALDLVAGIAGGLLWLPSGRPRIAGMQRAVPR